MRKKFMISFLALIAFLFMLPGPVVKAAPSENGGNQGRTQPNALPSQSELVTLNRRQDIVIAIGFDVEVPDVALVSPSGKVYAADSDYARVERADKVLYLYILNAESGSWNINYDKKGNSSLEVVVTPWNHPLSIDSLMIDEVQEGQLTASAEVSCGSQVRYQYYAYAVTLSTDGTVDGKTELSHGSGYSGNTLSLHLATQDLPDGVYYLQLEVYYTNDSGTEFPAFCISDTTFTVTGNTQSGDASQFISMLDLTQDILTLDWSGVEGRYTSWLLALYIGGGTEPAYYSSFDANVRSDELLLDRNEGDVRITLIGTVSGGGYVSFERTIRWNTGVLIEFETPEITNSLRGAIRFDTAGQTLSAELKINDGSEQLQLSGSDTLSFRLDEMDVNEISLQYQLEDGVYYFVSRRISVDSVPPTLTLYGLPDEVTTAEGSIIISGGTEAGASLTVNGEAHKTDGSGEFVAEIALKEGGNTLVFEASDAAGNKTSRTLIVNYSPSGVVIHTGGNDSDEAGGFPWILIITAACSLLTLLFIWVFTTVSDRRMKKDGGRAAVSRKLFAVLEGLLCSVSVSGIGLTALFMVLAAKTAGTISGSNLIAAIEKYNTSEFADILTHRQSLQNWALAIGITAAVAMILMILLLCLGRKLGKEKKIDASQGIVPNVCPNCGAPVQPGNKFCASCGKPV